MTDYRASATYSALVVSPDNAAALLAWGYTVDSNGMGAGLYVVYDQSNQMVCAILSEADFNTQYTALT